jgi:hypothetical protein
MGKDAGSVAADAIFSSCQLRLDLPAGRRSPVASD